MMRDIVTKISIALVVVCLLLVSCGEVVTELPLTPVFLIPQLNLELDNFIGEKVWVSGYYGDDRISGEGYGFLVTDFDMLLFGQELPEHCCALLDGELPGYTETGAEILVYGEVKEFGEAYDAFTLEPTALITVEEYNILPPPRERPIRPIPCLTSPSTEQCLRITTLQRRLMPGMGARKPQMMTGH